MNIESLAKVKARLNTYIEAAPANTSFQMYEDR
jgi:hypothetical protein